MAPVPKPASMVPDLARWCLIWRAPHCAPQIVLLGSDGREHMFLAKPKDDLRKDHRMMEVASVINRLFAREPGSRRRNLYLRRCAGLRRLRSSRRALLDPHGSVP